MSVPDAFIVQGEIVHVYSNYSERASSVILICIIYINLYAHAREIIAKKQP